MKIGTISLLIFLICGVQTALAYRVGSRWSRTAVNGPGLLQGDPTTLTWGFVPDGTTISNSAVGLPNGSSDLIASLDSWFGAGPGGSDYTQRPWFTLFEQSFDRFAQLSGLSYQYEPNDDGVTQGTGAFAGFVGTRADVRIGGNFIDGAFGANNTLAFNNFPQNGDMTFDTADGSSFASATLNSRFFRNTIMHEHGHGTGNFHVESANGRFLMEPFIQTTFDGPQFDDVLGLHRGYGDFFEKSNGGQGNNTFGNATDLGTIPDASTVSIGVDGNENFVVTSNEVDFVSIDDNSDLDFYSFTVGGPSLLDVTLAPVGPTYLEGPQFGTQSSYVTSELSDLTLQLYDTDGTTLLTSQNAGGLGFTESILDFNLNMGGEYFLRISGAQNNVQMYQLDVGVESSMMIVPGDFDGDGDFACADVDALVQAIVAGDNDDFYDLTGEGVVNNADLTEWLALAGAAELASGTPYLVGDANLDGVVDGVDFVLWNNSKFTSTAAWCSGDFNASGTVDGQDYVLWNTNKFTSADLHAVPEPTTGIGALLAAVALGICRRRMTRSTC